MIFKPGMIPYNKADLIGRRFGRLLVVEELPSKNKRSIWLCECDCGNITKVDTSSLQSEHTTSCGCYKKEKGFQCGENHINWKGGFSVGSVRMPLYRTYKNRLDYCEKIRSSRNGLLEVSCAYCGKFFVPTLDSVIHRLASLNGGSGECRFYCSEGCKKSCPTFSKIKYPKGFKPDTSREVQPELRQLVFERDNYTCQKCGKTVDEIQIHCHHIDPVSQNPIESADVDNCITLCKDCHKKVHRQKGCRYNELKCEEM